VRFEADFIGSADGSVLIEAGRTRVICTASILDSAPPFADAKGMGWVTAEYGMLPASTGRRKSRPGLRPDGRGTEIRRIIGRALRAVCDLTALAGRTIVLDCDVIEADGGTRTASITGSYVALALALEKAGCDGRIEHADRVIADSVAAVSVGLVDGRALLDLDYPEDSGAEVDMNVAMTGRGRLIEVQATGETATFSRAQLDRLLALASRGCRSLAALQRKVLRKGAKR
jgi:ribonuclease PH